MKSRALDLRLTENQHPSGFAFHLGGQVSKYDFIWEWVRHLDRKN